METEERVREIYIPPNFKEGTSVMGFMIKPLFVIQAVPFVLAMVLLVFIVLHSLSLTAKVIILAVTCIPVVFLCIVGINGDSVFRFIRNAIRFRRTKRTCLYNPRIKSEIKPLSEDPFSVQQLPRERILAFMEKMKKEREDELDNIDLTNLYFEDDEGIVAKPYEYMSAKERREYEKQKSKK